MKKKLLFSLFCCFTFACTSTKDDNPVPTNSYTMSIITSDNRTVYNRGETIKFLLTCRNNGNPINGESLGVDDSQLLLCKTLPPTDENGKTEYTTTANFSGGYSFAFYNKNISGTFAVHIQESAVNDSFQIINNVNQGLKNQINKRGG